MILFRSLSAVVRPVEQSFLSGYLFWKAAFLVAVQAQFISFTYQKNDTNLLKASNAAFFLGVIMIVIGAASS